MKQAILLSGSELSDLRRGKMLEINVGGEMLLIGVDKADVAGRKKMEKQLQHARAVKAEMNGGPKPQSIPPAKNGRRKK